MKLALYSPPLAVYFLVLSLARIPSVSTTAEHALSENCNVENASNLCPPWSTWNSDSNHCVCAEQHLNGVHCGKEITEVTKCYCLTYSMEREEYSLGRCIYSCGEGNSSRGSGDNNDILYWKVDSDQTKLNEEMCGDLGRNGTLCGQCVSNRSVLAYSYDVSCVECPDGPKNWWKFVLAAFLPLTVFYLFIFLCKVSITPAYIYSFVFYAQAVSTPVFLRSVLLTLGYENGPYVTAFKVLSSLYGIWSLDFCRALYDDICFNLDTQETLALEYAIALYPLLLIFLSYIGLSLYACNFRCFVYLCKPFHFLSSAISRNWDTTQSLIDAYMAFFILSLTKIVYVSFDLLIPTKVLVLEADGMVKHHYALYFDGSKRYFGKEHLPFAILAIVIFTVFVIFPSVILCLYPLTCFQQFLNRFNCNMAPLHHLVDKFQGFYQNGRDPGTRDYRYFSAYPVILFVLMFSIYGLTQSIIYYPLAAVAMIVSGLIYAIVQPYKHAYSHYTKINIGFFSLIAIQHIMIAASDVSSVKEHNLRNTLLILSFTCSLVPLVYISLVVIVMVSRGTKLMDMLSQWFRRCQQPSHEESSEQDPLLSQNIRPLSNYM